MAGLLIGIAGAGLSAVIFKAVEKIPFFGSNSREAEINRHNRAEERIQRNSVRWNQQRLSQQDWERRRIRREKTAGKHLGEDTNALRNYYYSTQNNASHGRNEPIALHEKEKADSTFEIIGITLSLFGTGYLVYKYRKSL